MKKNRQKIFYFLTYIILTVVLIALFAFPTDVSDAVTSSLSVCVKSVIPSLFPFLVISAMIVSSGLSEKIGRVFSFPIQKVLRLPGESATAILIGFLSGYPVGAATAIDLYNRKAIGKKDAERLLAFCNNTGPAFVIGAVGVGMFGDAKIGIALYLVHIVSALIVGMLFSLTVKKCDITCAAAPPHKPNLLKKVVVDSVRSAALNTLYIVSFVVFFGVIIKIVCILCNVSQSILLCAVSSVTEVTSGVSSISSLLGVSPLSLILASGALGWAGLSVHAQVMSILADTDLSMAPYIAGKAAHALIAALLTFLLLIL